MQKGFKCLFAENVRDHFFRPDYRFGLTRNHKEPGQSRQIIMLSNRDFNI